VVVVEGGIREERYAASQLPSGLELPTVDNALVNAAGVIRKYRVHRLCGGPDCFRVLCFGKRQLESDEGELAQHVPGVGFPFELFRNAFREDVVVPRQLRAIKRIGELPANQRQRVPLVRSVVDESPV
jgi:hypothetical protein